ncbi:DUF1648 domain-containing protein [Kineococcus glutinatus]|uniref:DUF1648 domain-containing protein n=1 Tax=Kineococcus glutinatus TaxID=1070872 RepID=A0ABP9HAW7_9ACTN
MARGAFVLSALVFAAVVAVSAAVLPERVPVHFGASLEADSYAGRTTLVLLDAGLWLTMTALFAGLAVWTRRAPLELVNVPNAAYWKRPEHEAELRRRLVDDLLSFGTATLLLLAAVTALVTHGAVAGGGRLSAWVWVALAGYAGWVALHCARALTVRYRVPAAAGSSRGPGSERDRPGG